MNMWVVDSTEQILMMLKLPVCSFPVVLVFSSLQNFIIPLIQLCPQSLFFLEVLLTWVLSPWRSICSTFKTGKNIKKYMYTYI